MEWQKSIRYWQLAIPLFLGVFYSNHFQGPFVFDDLKSIPENPTIRNLWQSLLTSPGEGETVSSRPLVNFSFALNYAWSGLEVWSYHLVNLMIHMTAALVLFAFLRKTLSLPCFPQSVQTRSILLAGSISLLWGLHPLHTESVTYIVQRAESMMGLFYLATLWSFTQSINSRSSNRWQIVSVGLCYAGMLTKEIMVTAPWVILLYDRIFIESTLSSIWEKRRVYYRALFSSWIVFAVLFVQSGRRGDAIGFGGEISGVEYLQTQAWALSHYLKLFFIPNPLVLDYGVLKITEIGVVLPCALLICLGGLTIVWLLRHRPVLGFWGVWMGLILGPTSSFIPIQTQTIAEHRTYLALIPLIFYGVYFSYNRWGERIIYGVFLFAIFWGVLTYRRNEDYQTLESIYKTTVEEAPYNERARNNYAGALAQLKKWDEAEVQMLTILKMERNPSPIRFKNLGAIYQNQGRWKEAEIFYRRALELEKRYPEGWFHLTSLLVQQNRIEEALKMNQEAVYWNPHEGVLQSNLASIYVMLKREEEAKTVLQIQIKIKTSAPSIYLNLGMIYEKQGQGKEAERVYLQAIENGVMDPLILERLSKLQEGLIQ